MSLTLCIASLVYIVHITVHFSCFKELRVKFFEVIYYKNYWGSPIKYQEKLEEEQNKKTMKNKKTIYHLPPTTRKTMKNKENRLTITTYGQFKYYVITFGEGGKGGRGLKTKYYNDYNL